MEKQTWLVTGTSIPKRFFLILLASTLLFAASAIAAQVDMKDFGSMTPQQALEYMKTAKDLVIVDVASKSRFSNEHFTGAINIPIENISQEEAKVLYMQIPTGHPVLLHCRRGVIVPGAYRTLKQLRPDIPEIGYIDGVPPFKEYNDWAASQK